MRELTELVLTERQPLAPNTLQLVFEEAGGGPLPYRPGQFISLHFDYLGARKQRSYSIATRCENPAANHRLEFAIAYVEGGPASEVLFAAAPGYRAAMTGPFGKLLLPEQLPPRLILCATGTGVAPYRAMAPRLQRELQANPALVVELLFGCRRRADCLYAQEWLALAGRLPGFHYRVCLSREAPQATHECGGHLQAQLQALSPQPGRDRVYLCGNPAMIDEAFVMLKQSGFDHRSVRREKFLLAGR